MSETFEKSFETIIEFHLLENGYLNVPKDGFDLRDREENYRIAWEKFKRRRLWILDS